MHISPIAVRCKIQRGGFSGERVVVIRIVDGSECKGLAPTHYCWDAKMQPLGEEDPASGQVDGFVAARKYESTAPNHVYIEIPDGEVMLVAKESIVPRPPEEATHVPVRQGSQMGN